MNETSTNVATPIPTIERIAPIIRAMDDATLSGTEAMIAAEMIARGLKPLPKPAVTKTSHPVAVKLETTDESGIPEITFILYRFFDLSSADWRDQFRPPFARVIKKWGGRSRTGEITPHDVRRGSARVEDDGETVVATVPALAGEAVQVKAINTQSWKDSIDLYFHMVETSPGVLKPVPLSKVEAKAIVMGERVIHALSSGDS